MRDALQLEWNSYTLIPSIFVDVPASDPLQFWKYKNASSRHCLLSLSTQFVLYPPVVSSAIERVLNIQIPFGKIVLDRILARLRRLSK